jgi:Raf kinase inhibitor-like YbhB/YbcL family protein
MYTFLLALALLSSVMQHQGTAPQSMLAAKCGGTSVSPELRWSGTPSGTKSFALVMYDPDAPGAGAYQWVVYDIPSSTHSVAAGATPAGATVGTNVNGTTGFAGPCPPAYNKHHYATFLYALDVAKLGQGEKPLTGFELQKSIKGHILGHAVLVVTYEHQPAAPTQPSPTKSNERKY